MSCNGEACNGGIDCRSGCAIEAFNEHAIASGTAGLSQHRQTMGGFVPLYEVKEPPGKPLPNRKERREWARIAARQLNRQRRQRVVAVAPGNRETCEHGQLAGQCTECAKRTGK